MKLSGGASSSKPVRAKPSRKAPAVKRVRGTEQHRDNGPEMRSVNADKNAPKTTGRAKAMASGRGRKVGLTRQTSSAASKFSPAQKKSYAAMNQRNSRNVAASRARNAAMSGGSSTGNYSLQKPRNVLDQAHESFFDIGRFLRDRTR